MGLSVDDVRTPTQEIVNPYGGTTTLPGSGPRSGAPGNTADGRWLVFGVGTNSEPIRSLVDLSAGAAKTVQLLFLARTAAYNRPALLPDHSAAIVPGRADSSSGWGFYEVSLVTGDSRRIATIPGDLRLYHCDLSPDGRQLAYTYDASTQTRSRHLGTRGSL
jgi:hypothetical protein